MDRILGKKIKMGQIFDETKGEVIPVTFVDVSNNIVARAYTGKKSSEGIHFIELGKDVKKHPVKSLKGQYKNFVPRFKSTFRVSTIEGLEEGSEVKAESFSAGDIVDVRGVSKGKGFVGVMKRHGFKGGKATHGQSDRERAPGSIGPGTTPGRVHKGKRMAGRMGRENVTIKNLKVVEIDKENGIMLINGAVPGNNGSYLTITKKK